MVSCTNSCNDANELSMSTSVGSVPSGFFWFLSHFVLKQSTSRNIWLSDWCLAWCVLFLLVVTGCLLSSVPVKCYLVTRCLCVWCSCLFSVHVSGVPAKCYFVTKCLVFQLSVVCHQVCVVPAYLVTGCLVFLLSTIK